MSLYYRCTWKSFNFLYSCFLILLALVHILYIIRWLTIDSINTNKISKKNIFNLYIKKKKHLATPKILFYAGIIVFYLTSLLLMILIVRLAYHWPNLINFWEKIENKFLLQQVYGPPNDFSLSLKFKILCSSILTLALGIHHKFIFFIFWFYLIHKFFFFFFNLKK